MNRRMSQHHRKTPQRTSLGLPDHSQRTVDAGVGYHRAGALENERGYGGTARQETQTCGCLHSLRRLLIRG
jgi:hypothetical protein